MRQLIQNYRSGHLEVADVPAPGARARSVLVSTRASLISAGTERSSAQMARRSLVGKAVERPDLVRKVIAQVSSKGLVETARMVFSRLDAPVAPGYSCAGVVVDVGRDVPGIRIGDRVACAGQNHASHAEVVLVPRNLCVKIPEGVDFDDASYVAVGAIALQGIRQAEPALGEAVAVIGLGLVGQLTVQMLVASGCVVVATDLDATKLDLARTVGATAVPPDAFANAVIDMTSGRGADAVIIAASTKSDGPVTQAAEVCRKRGRVIVVGAVGMNLPREPFYIKEIDFRLSTSYGPGRYDATYEEHGVDYPHAYVRWTEQRNMEAFLALLQSGKVRARDVTTHRFPIERAEEAYQLILDGTEPYLGVTLQYPGTDAPRLRRTTILRPSAPAGAVRLGIIGAGNHVNDMLLPQLERRRDVEIRAVCTGSGMKARSVAAKWQAAYCTTDAAAVLDDASVNAVLIGTRHDSHAALVIRALRAGKHVFVEKPLCLTEEELAAVLEAYAQSAAQGPRLMVGFNRRYSPHAQKIRAALEARTSPLVMTYRVNAGAIDASHWVHDARTGGGRLIGEGCHFVDFMQYIAGAPVRTVYAVAVAHHHSGVTNDHALMTLEFHDGSVGSLVYAAGGDRALAKERFEAFADGRAIVLDDFRTTEIWRGGRRTRFRTSQQDKGFAGEMQAFCDSIVRPDAPHVPIAEVEAVTRACLLAERSLRSGEKYTVAVS